MAVVGIDFWLLMGIIMGYFPIIIILILVFWLTPAGTWLLAKMKKQAILIGAQGNRYMKFIRATQRGGIAETKKDGYFEPVPEDFFFEQKTKIPLALVYSTTAFTINPKYYKIAQNLRNMGIKNKHELDSYYNELKNKGQDLEIKIGKKGMSFITFYEDHVLGNKPIISGDSVRISDVAEYFNRNERSDLIEAEIQRRGAAQVARFGRDNFKWLIYLSIFIFISVMAFYILQMSFGSSPAEIMNTCKDFCAQTAGNRVVTGGGTTLT